jgi:peptidoglycan hydrolase CwlO-like protein
MARKFKSEISKLFKIPEDTDFDVLNTKIKYCVRNNEKLKEENKQLKLHIEKLINDDGLLRDKIYECKREIQENTEKIEKYKQEIYNIKECEDICKYKIGRMRMDKSTKSYVKFLLRMIKERNCEIEFCDELISLHENS